MSFETDSKIKDFERIVIHIQKYTFHKASDNRQMNLQPIDDSNLASAQSLLLEGFPERTASFWKRALDRLRLHQQNPPSGSIGYLMIVLGEPVGIILTIRNDWDATCRRVNLSSWYVREKHRWLAARMLQKVVSEKGVAYTDLTPSAETVKINNALGFKSINEQVTLFALPFTALAGNSSGTVIPHHDCPDGAISQQQQALMRQHAQLGCICAVLEHDGRHSPLIFSRAMKFGLPVARLVYASNRYLISGSGRAISRFLLKQGMLFMTLRTASEERMAGGLTWKKHALMQVKGKWDASRVDLTFSELVFLRL